MPDLVFKIPGEKRKQIDEWAKIQDVKVCFKQKRPLNSGPNYGSCGGAYSYIFIPTSIGTIVKIRNSMTGEELDVSEDF